MVLRSRQEHGDISNSCSRKMESHSRWKVQNLSRFDRMDARSQSVQTDNQTSGTPRCGSVCLSGKSSDTRACVMEARTRGNSNRCFQYPLGLSTELPVSSFLPDTNVPKESNVGRLHSHCSSMEEPAMVSSTHIHVYRAPLLLPQGCRILKFPGTDKIHCLCCQKKFQLAAWKISGKACKTKAFQKKCQKFYYPPREATQPSNMKVLGKAGIAGVVKKRLTHSV